MNYIKPWTLTLVHLPYTYSASHYKNVITLTRNKWNICMSQEKYKTVLETKLEMIREHIYKIEKLYDHISSSYYSFSPQV